MLCKDIMEMFETTYPKHAALSWDNVGLLVGRTDKKVHTILIALDATDEVIEQAISQNVDLLITHHPLIFEPLKTITNEHFIGNRVVRLLQHDISYYAMHTNYDVLGMADLSAKMLELADTEVFEATNEEGTEGIGRVGHLPTSMTLKECCELVKEKFQLETVKVYGDLNMQVERVAISPGSGKHMSELAIEKQVQALITAEIDHHEGIDANARGVAIVDAGHYGLEHIFIQDMYEYLGEKLTDVKILKTEIVHPFQIV